MAVIQGLDNAVQWILAHDYRHVLIEVNNECDVNYEHPILQPPRVHELIERVKSHRRHQRRLYVGTSFGGGTIPSEMSCRRQISFAPWQWREASSQIALMVQRTRQLRSYRPMPILFNEDDHFDFDKPMNHMIAAISTYASWGYFDPGRSNYVDGYQCPPVNWGINTERKQAFFALLKEITGF